MTDSATTPPSQPMAVLPGGEVTEDGPMLAADGRPLKHSLNRALRREKLRAFLLVSPLLIFILPCAGLAFDLRDSKTTTLSLPLFLPISTPLLLPAG